MTGWDVSSGVGFRVSAGKLDVHRDWIPTQKGCRLSFFRPVGCASYGDDTKAIVHNP